MPTLPIIDLLILLGWNSLFGAFALEAIYVTTTYRPTLFGLGPLDFVIAAGIFLLFSVALAARTWVKAYESGALGQNSRAAATLEAYANVRGESSSGAPAVVPDVEPPVDDSGESPSVGHARRG